MHGNPEIWKHAKPTGRPKGRLNDATLEGRRLAQEIVRDPIYRESLLERARNGTLGTLEPTLWAYAWGKPKEHIAISHETPEPYGEMSNEELAERAEQLAELVRQLDQDPSVLLLKELPSDAKVQ
jgi:hypothetical protein